MNVNTSDYVARNANDPWSLTDPDSTTFRFEVRDGDYAAIDASNYTKNERSDVVFNNPLQMGTPVEVNFNLNLEPGARNSASFLVLGQLAATMSDGTTAAQPAFDIDLIGDQVAAYVRYTDASGKVAAKTIYMANAALVRGQGYNFDVKAILDPSGNGRLVLSIDGVVVANYAGPLGYAGQQSANWVEGINRGANATETIAADFSGTAITTGSQIAFPDPVPYVAPPSMNVSQFAAVAGAVDTISVDLYGYALGNSTVSFYSNGSLVGTTVAASNGYYATSVGIGGTGDHFLDASYTTGSGQVSVSAAPTDVYIEEASSPVSVNPNILVMMMNGDAWWVQNAAKPWSVTSPEPGTLRFEVRDADVFINDKNVGTFSERSEIKDETGIPDGTPLDVSYQFQIEPGAANDAKWTIVGQLHPGDVLASPVVLGPPFEVALKGEKMQINIVATDASGIPYVATLYTDIANIVRGHYYNMEIKAIFDPSGNGRLVVVRDGVTLVDYSGSLGYAAQSAVYWREGVYRSSTGTVTMAADYKNLSIVSGSSVTMPAQGSFIASPTVTSSAVSAVDGNGNQTVTFNGVAKANTTVSFSEEGVVLGTSLADANGNYSISINLNTATVHYLTGAATDAVGRTGISLVTVVDTAADIAANIATLQANAGVSAIVLTDTTVLPLTTTSIGTFTKAYAATLSKIVGTYSFVRTTTVTGQSYDTLKQYYSSAGVLTEADRYAASRLVSATAYAFDGSQVATSYAANGSVTVVKLDKNGRTFEVDSYTASNVLYSVTQYANDGSRLTLSYNQTTGVQTGYTSIDPTGAKQVVTVNITGQAYTQQVLSYTAAGKLTKQERFTSTGVKIYSLQYLADGSTLTQQFDANGIPTTSTWRYTDGTYATETFQIANQPFAAKTLFYTAAGKVFGTDTFSASGILLSSVRTNPDSSTTVFAIDVLGNKTGYTQSYPNGSRAVGTYAAGQLASLSSYDPSGRLLETDVYNSTGQKISTNVFSPGGGALLTTLDPSSGLATGTTQTSATGGSVVTLFAPGLPGQPTSVSTYDPSGQLLETDLYNGAGQKISTNVVSQDGSTLLTTLDPNSGLAISTTQTSAGGVSVVTLFAPVVPGQPTSVSTYDPSGRLIETDLYNGAGQKVSTNVLSQDGSTLLTTLDPNSGLAISTTQTSATGVSVVTLFAPGLPGQPTSVSTYDPSGRLIETDLYNGAGQRISITVWNQDGSTLLTALDPISGLAILKTQTNIGGSKLITTYQSGSGTLVARTDAYLTTGMLSETDLYNGAGQRISSNIYAVDGSQVLTQFNGVTGATLSVAQVQTDQSQTVTLYTGFIQGQITAINKYSSVGVLIASQIYGADGSIKTYAFDAKTGLANGYTLVQTGGSKTVATFVPGNEALLLTNRVYSPSGTLTEVDGYSSSGNKISASLFYTDGSRANVSFDPSTGSPSRSVTYNLDGTTTQTLYLSGMSYAKQSTIYSATNKLLSMTRYYGDANSTVALTQVVNADGSSDVCNFDTSGRKTGEILTIADGSKQVTAQTYSGASLTPVSTSLYQYDTKGQLLWNDTTAQDGSHRVTAAVSGVSLTSHGGVADTFVAASGGADVFIFKPSFGQDIITNFHVGAGSAHDTIDLSSFGLTVNSGQTSLDVLLQSMRQVGRNAVISMTPTDTITLNNVLVSNLTKEDFRLA